MDIKQLPFVTNTDFNTKSVNLKSKKVKNFENYLEIALKEIENAESLNAIEKQKIHLINQKLEYSFSLMEKINQLDNSSSQTIGEYLLSQALEIEKIANTISQEGLSNFYKNCAVFIGVEAQKILQGFYSS